MMQCGHLNCSVLHNSVPQRPHLCLRAQMEAKSRRVYRGSFKPLCLHSFIRPSSRSPPSLHARAVVKHTCWEPHLPPSFSLCEPEWEETRQINVEISTKPLGVGGNPLLLPHTHLSIHLPDTPSICPSLSLFHVIKRADSGPFCCALIGHLVMWHR